MHFAIIMHKLMHPFTALIGEGKRYVCYEDASCEDAMGIVSKFCCGRIDAGSYRRIYKGKLRGDCYRW